MRRLDRKETDRNSGLQRKHLFWAAGALAAAALGVVVLSLILSAEDEAPEKAASAETPAPAAGAPPASSDTPLTFKAENEHATIELSLPESLKAAPELHQALYAEGVRDLQAFAEGAMADRTEMEGEGLTAMPYARSIDWKPAGETGKLLSVRADVYEFTGGAHPNGTFDARLWDKAMKRAVAPAALFKGGADRAALERLLCDGVKAAKKGRTGETWTPDNVWPCPKLDDTRFVLAPGPTGRAGGLTFLIAPYAVGPYAEGAYEVTLPAAAVRPHLAPAYADEFAG